MTLKSYLRFEGADGSKVIVDDAPRLPVVGTPKVWTAVGGAQIDTAEKRMGQSSLKCTIGQYISTADTADLSLGTKNFTLEWWMNYQSVAADGQRLISQLGATSITLLIRRIVIAEHVNGSPNAIEILMQYNNGVGQLRLTTSSLFSDTLNVGWHHFALQREGGTIRLFVDGFLEDSNTLIGSSAIDDTEGVFHFGLLDAGGGTVWYDEFRYSIGIARYPGTDSPVNAEHGLASPTVKSCVLFDGVDASTTVFDSATPHRVWTVNAGSELDTADKIHGMSSLKVASGGGASTPDSADFALGTNNFTVECFFKCNASLASGFLALTAQWNGTPAQSSFILLRLDTGQIAATVYDASSGTTVTGTTIFTDALNTGWHHAALVRTGNTLKLFIDGVQEGGDVSFSASISNSSLSLRVGAGETLNWIGWIDCFRFTNGSARYTSNFSAIFTPLGVNIPVPNFIPPSCFGYDQYVKILHHFEGPDGSTVFADSAPSQPSWLVQGAAQLDTAQKKFGQTSLACLAADDFIAMPANADFAIGANDFTLETWFFNNNSGANFCGICGQATENNALPNSENAFLLFRFGSLKYLQFTAYVGSGSYTLQSSTTFSTTDNPGWHHVAVVRKGNSLKMFIDGYLEASTTITGAINSSAQAFMLGRYSYSGTAWIGWLDDFRLYIGEAKYTANFTIDAPYVWPNELPQCPNLQSLVEQAQANLVVSKPDVGPPKMRRRSTARGVATSATFRMSADQLVIFEDFFENTLADGSLPFQWTHPRLGKTFWWMFSPDDPPRISRIAPKRYYVDIRLLRLPS